MRANKVLQFIIFIFLLFFLINSSYNYVINHFLIKTDIIKEGVLLKGFDTQGFVFWKESLISSEQGGTYKFFVKEGQRIGKRTPIASYNGKNILSPVSGIITFKYDNLESIKDPFDSSSFSFEEIATSYQEIDNSGKESFEIGETILKIRDNLDLPKIYLEVPLSSFNEPLQNGRILKAKFVDNEKVLRLKIVKLKGLGQNALMVLEFLDIPEKYNRIQDMKIISEEIKTVLVPQKAVLSKNDKQGIYVVKKGFVIFKEINIIGEEEEFYLTDTLEPLTEIVINPKFAKDGKYIR